MRYYIAETYFLRGLRTHATQEIGGQRNWIERNLGRDLLEVFGPCTAGLPEFHDITSDTKTHSRRIGHWKPHSVDQKLHCG